MGADDEHIGAHHAEDHKSGDICVKEFGWYLADCAGLADYRDGGLEGYTADDYARMMKSTIKSFEDAVDYVQERQKRNKHPLHLPDAMRHKYEDVLKGHRQQVNDLFKACDADDSGTLDVDELKDIIKEVEGKEFNDKDFMSFFKGKGPNDNLSKLEFGWYIAEQAGSQGAVGKFIDKMNVVRQKVHDEYRIAKKLEGKL